MTDTAAGESTALVIFAPNDLATFSDGLQAEVERIAAAARAMVDGADVSTDEGRALIRSTAYKVAQSKTALDRVGMELVAEQKRAAAKVDDERRKMRTKLDAVRDFVRKPLTEYEEREVARKLGHEAEIARLESLVLFHLPPGVTELKTRMIAFESREPRAWEEYMQRASETALRVGKTLESMLADAEKREAEAAELNRLRAEQAAREQKERDERIAAEAAAKATREAEAKAAAAAAAREQEQAEANRQALIARQKEQEAREAAEARAAKAEQHAKDAAAFAVQQEQDRAAREKAAQEAEAKAREADKAHRRKINREAAQAIDDAIGGKITGVAEAVIVAIAKGNVPHVKITY